MIPDESNAFARAIASKEPPGPVKSAAKKSLGVVLTLVLVSCLGLALYLVGALLSRAARHGDWVALLAVVLVTGMTYVMARGRRK